MLCATFPTVPVVALTATASKRDVTEIKVSLNLKNPLEIVGNPNRPNIFYKKVFRRGDDVDFFYELLNPIAIGLKEKKVDYPISILYLPLRWCGFSFKFFQSSLVMISITHQLTLWKGSLKTGCLRSTILNKQGQ